MSLAQVAMAGASAGVLGLLAMQKLKHFIAELTTKFANELMDKFVEKCSAEKFDELMKSVKSIESNLDAVAVTSQVCATRANVMEWRSCLAATASWHSCSWQSAYQLWRRGAVSMPSCPANIGLAEFVRGSPMSLADEVWEEVSNESVGR